MSRRHIVAATAVTALGFAAANHAAVQKPTTHVAQPKPRKHLSVRDALPIVVSPRPVAASRSEQREPATTQAPMTHPFRSGDPTAAQWAELRACEASGDYTLHDPPYYGAYQFDLQTWAAVGGHGNPADASPAEQDARALALWRDRGWQPWPVCGYAKWGAR